MGIETEHLTQLDAVSMANSIEARVPFLDKEVVSFAAKLPGFVLAPNDIDNKFLFRQAFKDVLPLDIINLSKTGFNNVFNKLLLLVDIELWCMLNIDNLGVETVTNEMFGRCFDRDRYSV